MSRLGPADEVEQGAGAFQLFAVLGVPLGVTLALASGRGLRDPLRGVAEDGVQAVAQLAEHLGRHGDERLRVGLLPGLLLFFEWLFPVEAAPVAAQPSYLEERVLVELLVSRVLVGVDVRGRVVGLGPLMQAVARQPQPPEGTVQTVGQ